MQKTLHKLHIKIFASRYDPLFHLEMGWGILPDGTCYPTLPYITIKSSYVQEFSYIAL